MNKAQEDKILKYLNQVKKNLTDIIPNLRHIESVSKHLLNAEIEIMIVCDVIKRSNQEEEGSGKEEKKESEAEIIRHKDEKQES